MKYLKIKLEDGKSILVDESAKIKENTNTFNEGFNGDWFYNSIYKTIARIGDITAYDFKLIATINHSIDLDVTMVIVEDGAETLTTLYQSHLRAFIQGLSFSHNPISDNAVGRFRTWYNQNPEIAAQQKGVYSEAQLRRAIELSTHVKPHHVLGKVAVYSTDEIIKSLNQEYIELEMEEVLPPNGNPHDWDMPIRIKTTRSSNGQLMAYIKQ